MKVDIKGIPMKRTKWTDVPNGALFSCTDTPTSPSDFYFKRAPAGSSNNNCSNVVTGSTGLMLDTEDVVYYPDAIITPGAPA